MNVLCLRMCRFFLFLCGRTTWIFHIGLMVAIASATWIFGGRKVMILRPEETATSKQYLASNQLLSLSQNKFVSFYTQFHHQNVLPISSRPFQIFSSKCTQSMLLHHLQKYICSTEWNKDGFCQHLVSWSIDKPSVC